MKRPGFDAPRLCVNDRSAVTGSCIVVGFGLGGWASVEAVHEPYRCPDQPWAQPHGEAINAMSVTAPRGPCCRAVRRSSR